MKKEEREKRREGRIEGRRKERGREPQNSIRQNKCIVYVSFLINRILLSTKSL